MCKLNYFNQIPAAYMQLIEMIMNPFIPEERAYSTSHQNYHELNTSNAIFC